MVQVDTGADNECMKGARLSLGTVGHHGHRMSMAVHQKTQGLDRVGQSGTDSRVGPS